MAFAQRSGLGWLFLGWRGRAKHDNVAGAREVEQPARLFLQQVRLFMHTLRHQLHVMLDAQTLYLQRGKFCLERADLYRKRGPLMQAVIAFDGMVGEITDQRGKRCEQQHIAAVAGFS
jgi:hypothetical protein